MRKADIEAQVNYFAQLLCRQRGLCKRRLAPEALRRLQSYDFPGNLTELESMVERAVSQSGQSSVMTEEVFWAEEKQSRRFRFNLFKGYSQASQVCAKSVVARSHQLRPNAVALSDRDGGFALGAADARPKLCAELCFGPGGGR